MIPKKVKYKKCQRGVLPYKIFSSTDNFFKKTNCICLIAKNFEIVSYIQLKALKQAITKILKKRGKIIFNAFAHTPITKKPLEIRMGKGKGAVYSWVAKIKPGFIICKIESKNLLLAKKALIYSRIRLPIKTKIL